MITKTIDENLISVIPEDSEDLLNLRRIIKENDKVIGDTTRVLKQDKEYSRPDKGERIKIRIALTVEKISLDEVLDKLRISGIIYNSKSGNTSLKWRQIRRMEGKVTGEASPNSLTNLAESGVLTLDWVENYLKKKSQEEKTTETTK